MNIRILVLVAILAVCSYASLSVQSYEESLQNPGLSMPRVQFSNNTQHTINGFIAYYYFTSAEPNPIFEPYYMEGGSGSVEHISGVNYRVKLDFSTVSLPAGSVFPSNSGISFGLHYASWANWAKEDDYSNNMSQTMASNNFIVVTNAYGQMLAGIYPDFNVSIPTQHGNTMARVYALKEGENNFAKIRLYVKNEGMIALDHFDFSIEITVENGQQPVLNTWHIPNTTYTVEQKNDSVWAFHFSTRGVSLEPNFVYPSGEGIYFGINYSNWSNVNTQNDYSLKELQNQYSLASQIPLYIDGKLISGNPKIHSILDIKKIIADENGYSLDAFNRSVESLLADIPDGDKKDFWGNVDIFFKDVPNYDSTQQAVGQIFAKFPGLDTLTFISLRKDIKSSYEQLVRLRMYERYATSISRNRMMLMKSYYYDECETYSSGANSEEFWLIFFSPMKYPGTDRAKDFAYAWAEDYAENILKIGRSNTYQNRADGFRHAVWNALLCRETGTQYDDIDDCLKWAKDFSDAHESSNQCTEQAPLDEPMDLHNNGIGRTYYKPYLTVGCEWSLPIIGCINHEVNGPSREDTKKMFIELANKGYGFNEVSQLSSPPWLSNIVFYRTDNGILYCKNEENSSNCLALEDDNTWYAKIGILKGSDDDPCNDEFSFYLDLENTKNGSKINPNFSNPPGITLDDSGNVRFTYCSVTIGGENSDYLSIPKAHHDYVVLRLNDKCPIGTYPFMRYHDTEDSNNRNSYSGNSGPNIIKENAVLEYCFVPASDLGTIHLFTKMFPTGKYGVFSSGYTSSAWFNNFEIVLNDENSNNKNSWYWYGIPKDIQTRIMNIMYSIDELGASYTVYNVISLSNKVHIVYHFSE